jgi:hypothetical protein
MGKNYLMHYVKHPEHVNTQQTWVYNQIPKRTRGQLLAPRDEQVPGWGIHFEEGFNWPVFGSLGLIIVILGSLVFGVAWGVLKKDAGTSFTIAAYWTNIATILMAFLAFKNAV